MMCHNEVTILVHVYMTEHCTNLLHIISSTTGVWICATMMYHNEVTILVHKYLMGTCTDLPHDIGSNTGVIIDMCHNDVP